MIFKEISVPYITSIILTLATLVVIAISIIKVYNINIKKRLNNISFKEALELTGLPVITFYNGDQKLNFMLDTGSNLSHITKSITSKLIYKDLNTEKRILGTGNNSIKGSLCEMKIKYKGFEYEDTFCITDFDSAFSAIKKESGVQIHGILGNQFFEKYKYVIDFKDFIAYMKK